MSNETLMISKETFLILNLAIAFYNIGTIWAHEIDILRTWKLLDPKTFHIVKEVHRKKIPYWILIPVGLSFIGSIVLFWYHSDKIPNWEIWVTFMLQFISLFLTAIFFVKWQAKLAKDELGGASPWLDKILRTHWIRTVLINTYGLMLLYMTIQSLS
jgi:hypothetical protein